MEPNILYKEESYKIIGACFEVYKAMGCGFLEAVCQECLAMEFNAQGIQFIEQPSLKLAFKGKALKQTYEPDFLCFNEIIVELKATKNLIDDFRAQTINYLKTTKKQLALLVNFGHYPNVEYERFVNDPLSRSSRVS
jgi:GxxExxY protein